MRMKEHAKEQRRIDPHGVYDRLDVMRLLKLEKRGMAKAVREQGLRYARVGLGYTFLGSWIIAWLENVSQQRQVELDRNERMEPCP